MSLSSTQPTAFITSIIRSPSSSAPTTTSTSTSSSLQTATSIPQAPPVSPARSASTTDGWSPGAIIGIVTAIVFIILCVPLIAIVMRRYGKKKLRETVGFGGSSKASLRSVKEDQSLRSILVTKELQRTSVKLVEGVSKPDEAHTNGRGWSRPEVRGGDWK